VPIYEYACQACGRIAEVMQKMSDPAPESCSSCHSGPLKKLISKTAVVLKGGGWYTTDFKDGKASTGKPRTEPTPDAPAAAAAPAAASEPAKPAAPAPATTPKPS
jgi:putative FmdB family regulatory protein